MLLRLMVWIRVALAAGLALILLEAANWAVRGCSTGPDASENCLWLGVRRHFRLPSSRLLRAGLLEAAGLVILAGFFLTFRYLWPRGQGQASRVDIEATRIQS